MQALVRSSFQSWEDGARTDLHTLRGPDGLEVAVCNHGARLVRVAVPDGQGGRTEVILGYDSLAGYLSGHLSMGAFIGRWAGRLRQGGLRLPDHSLLQLPCNGGSHAVHGGPRGSRVRTFQVTGVRADALELGLVFRPEDDGVPGTLRLRVGYQALPGQVLRITWRAEAAGAATLAQFTAHPFFNLAGEGSAMDHVLQIPASRFLPVAPDACPQGSVASVEGSPLDFRLPRTPREALRDAHPQLQAAQGLDHYLLLDTAHPAQPSPWPVARLHCPQTGLALQVASSEPGLQLYAARGFKRDPLRDAGRGGWCWAPGDALCLEPMTWPDAPNQPASPDPWLAAGATRHGEIVCRFSRCPPRPVPLKSPAPG